MLRERKRRHRVPELNTTSTADISFMLLTFFLVTTSMDSDNGIHRQLQPMPQEKQEQVAEAKRRDVLVVGIDAANRITCNGEQVAAEGLRAKVAEFVDNPRGLATMPEKVARDIPLLGRCSVTANHQIFVRADRAATYDAYFGVQDAIMAAYDDLRDSLAMRRFGHGYAECSDAERRAVEAYYPMRLSEGEIVEEGGAR